MSTLRSAKGKMVDMAALAKKNETAPAISPGTHRANAKGDLIDGQGKVIATVEDMARMQQRHAEPVEKAPVSDPKPASEPAPKPAKKASPPKAAKSGEKAKPKAVSETEKTRSDGTRYVEIEYDNGDVETKEIG